MSRNPNLLAAHEGAMTVPCKFCGAAVNEPCWVLKDGNGVPKVKFTLTPHKQRVKAAVIQRMKKK